MLSAVSSTQACTSYGFPFMKKLIRKRRKRKEQEKSNYILTLLLVTGFTYFAGFAFLWIC